MERIQKIIVVLLVIAIVFSVVSTMMNFSLINYEFQPINIKVPVEVPQGNPYGSINLFVEGNPLPAG